MSHVPSRSSVPDDGERRDRRRQVPAPLAWMSDEAQLRPVAIARVAGLTADAFDRWTRGAWTPMAADVPLLPALLEMHIRLVARYPNAQARRAWWCEARRAFGWLSPAELLRRGRIGEVLLLPLDRSADD